MQDWTYRRISFGSMRIFPHQQFLSRSQGISSELFLQDDEIGNVLFVCTNGNVTELVMVQSSFDNDKELIDL